MDKISGETRLILDPIQLGYRPSNIPIPKYETLELLNIAWYLGLPAITIIGDRNAEITSNYTREKANKKNIQIVQDIPYIQEDAVNTQDTHFQRNISLNLPVRISVTESSLQNHTLQQMVLSIKNKVHVNGFFVRILVDRMTSSITNQVIQELSLEKVELAFPYNTSLSEEEEIISIVSYIKNIRNTQIEQHSLMPPPKYNWSIPIFNHPEIILEQNDGQKHDIAVVVPIYNKEDVIGVVAQALLNQNLPSNKFELIFIDDGSEDKTTDAILSKVMKYPLFRNVRLLRMARSQKHNLGEHNFTAGRARNAAIRFANSELLLFLDGDMIASPYLLQNHIECQQSKGGAVIMGNRERLIPDLHIDEVSQMADKNYESLFNYVIPKEPGSVREALDHGKQWSSIDPNPWLTCASCNVSIPIIALEKAGFFDPFGTLWSLDDTDLFYRLHKSGINFYYEKKAVAFHHWHPNEGDLDDGKLSRIVTSVMFRKYLDIDILMANAYLFKDLPKNL